MEDWLTIARPLSFNKDRIHSDVDLGPLPRKMVISIPFRDGQDKALEPMIQLSNVTSASASSFDESLDIILKEALAI